MTQLETLYEIKENVEKNPGAAINMLEKLINQKEESAMLKGWEKTTILVNSEIKAKTNEAEAYINPDTPGLAITKTLARHGWTYEAGWTLTHIDSGKAALTGLKTARKAAMIINQYGIDRHDWTRSEAEISKDKELIESVIKAKREEGLG